MARGPSVRLLPRLDGENRFFWTSGVDGVLRFLGCAGCGRLVHPPSPRCPFCLSDRLDPRPVSGRGTVAAFTVNHHQWIPDSRPYVVGLVSLVEQPDVRLMTNLVDVEPEQITVGMEVEVVFEHVDDVYLPLFRPLDPARRSTPAPGGAGG